MGNHRPEGSADYNSGQRDMCAFNWPGGPPGSEPYPSPPRRSVIVRAGGERDVPPSKRGRPHKHYSVEEQQRTTPEMSSPEYKTGARGPTERYTSSPPWDVTTFGGHNISSSPSPWLSSHQMDLDRDNQSFQWTSSETMPDQQRQGGERDTSTGIHPQHYHSEEQRLYGTMRHIPPSTSIGYDNFSELTSDYSSRVRRTTVIPATSTTGSGGVIQQLVFQNQPPSMTTSGYSSSYDGHRQTESLVQQITSSSSSSSAQTSQYSDSSMALSSSAIDPSALHEPDSDGDLPLHIAVAKENEQDVAHLIHMMTLSSHRSSLDVYNKLKQTPLHVAIMTGHLSIVQRLLVAGSSPAFPDRHGNTAVHLAVRMSSIDCINILLNSPASTMALHQHNYNGFTPLHLAVFRRDINLIELLVSRGANCNTTDGTSGRTPLFHAVLNGHEDVVRKLISLGASVNMPNYAGVTPLVVATDRRLKNITSLLISRGATINARDEN